MSRRAAACGRSRHPTAAWRPDFERMEARLRDRLTAAGHAAPDLAAAVIAARGRTGLDRGDYATRLGVAPETVAAVEDGRG